MISQATKTNLGFLDDPMVANLGGLLRNNFPCLVVMNRSLQFSCSHGVE